MNGYTESVVTGEQVVKFMQTVDKDTLADLCTLITKELRDACEAVGNKYLELEHKFPEVMAAMGFSVIATCNAIPLDADPPVCVVVGPIKGIQHAAQPLIKAFNDIAREVKHDEEARG